MESVIEEFLAESFEAFEQCRPDLENLKNTVTDQDAIQRLYRLVHTIKGTSGFLMFSNLEGLTMAAQTVLGRLRDGALELSPAVAEDLLAACAATSAMLDHIKSHNNDGDTEHTDLIARLNRH
jgi:two-component system chemotaxis sensor kinase CheA